LYLSKLPWANPWTEDNASIFDRIAPDNLNAKFHIKVNAQNELLMFPYRLKVVSERVKNFKHVLEEQLKTLDTHYEFDAKQRGLGSLFKNHTDLLDKSIKIYTVELQPISLYQIQIVNPASVRQFEPKVLYRSKNTYDFYAVTADTSIFYSPEETSPEVIARLDALVSAGDAKMTKIIENGRYVGARTFEI
jgi:hypothetical protein